jgi:hypothetical protein
VVSVDDRDRLRPLRARARVDESAVSNQALGGLGSDPAYVTMALNPAGFARVYASRERPDHLEFRLLWRNDRVC